MKKVFFFGAAMVAMTLSAMGAVLYPPAASGGGGSVSNAAALTSGQFVTGGGGGAVASYAGVVHTNGETQAASFSNSVSIIDGANAQVVISNGVIGTVKATTNTGNLQTATLNATGGAIVGGALNVGTAGGADSADFAANGGGQSIIGDVTGSANGTTLTVSDGGQAITASAATTKITGIASIVGSITNNGVSVLVGRITNAVLTASRLVLSDANKALASAAASGAVPVNADGSTTTSAQVNTLFPGTVWSNGMSFAATASNSSVTFVDGANAQIVISNGVIGTVKAITNTGNIQTATLNTTGALNAGSAINASASINIITGNQALINATTAGKNSVSLCSAGTYFLTEGPSDNDTIGIGFSTQSAGGTLIPVLLVGTNKNVVVTNGTAASTYGNLIAGNITGNAGGSGGITNLYMVAGGSSFQLAGWNATGVFVPMFGGGTNSGTEAIVAQRMTAGIYIRDIDVGWIGVGNNTNAVATVMTNGTAANTTCNVNSAGSTTVPVFASDTSHEIFLPSGQNLSLRFTGNNASVASTGVSATWTFRYHY